MISLLGTKNIQAINQYGHDYVRIFEDIVTYAAQFFHFLGIIIISVVNAGTIRGGSNT